MYVKTDTDSVGMEITANRIPNRFVIPAKRFNVFQTARM